MDLLLAPFQSGFTQRGLVAAGLVAVTCAVVGVWVVLRSLSFMGDALAHGVIPGIAIATIRGFDLTLGAALGAAVTVLGVSLVSNRTRLTEDTGIGLLFVGLLSLGVIILSSADSFAVNVTAFLFGDVLGVTWGDVRLQALAAVVALVASAVLHRAFVALAFDERKAQLLGLRPRLARAVLLGLLAMTVVTAFRTVGSLLVFGLLIAPAAAATLVTRRLVPTMALAVAIGLVAVVAGLEVSYHLNLAGSAAMSGTAVLVFFLVLAGREITGVLRRGRAGQPRVS